MNIAAIYCRLSKDDEQQGESVSIETQRMILTDFCHRENFLIYDIYIDDGFSGLNFNRPDFMRMIADIEKGKINTVITKDLSRLGRDYIQTGYFTEVYFNKKNIRYIAVNDGIDTLLEQNDIAPFKNILNDMYAKDLSRKVKTARRQRSLRGYYLGNQAPYGYKVDPENKNHLVVDEEAANVVKIIFKEALNGKNFSEISRKLTNEKVITPSAYKYKNGDYRFLKNISTPDSVYSWSYQTIGGILKNQMYVGDMINHKTEIKNYKTKERLRIPREEYIVVANMHEPIVSREVFEKVQQILFSRQKSKRHSYENVFKNKVFCQECGEPLTLIKRIVRGKEKKLLKCFNHHKNPEICTHYHAIYYDDLYDAVLNRLKEILCYAKKGETFKVIKQQLFEQYKEQKLLDEKAELCKTISALKKDISIAQKSLKIDEDIKAIVEKKQKEIDACLFKMSNLQETQDTVLVDDVIEKTEKLFNIEKLDENVVNKMIKRIEIGHLEKSEKENKRNINIIYNFNKED